MFLIFFKNFWILLRMCPIFVSSPLIHFKKHYTSCYVELIFWSYQRCFLTVKQSGFNALWTVVRKIFSCNIFRILKVTGLIFSYFYIFWNILSTSKMNINEIEFLDIRTFFLPLQLARYLLNRMILKSGFNFLVPCEPQCTLQKFTI